jgi:vacuole morphology and inheritance protein 14
LKLIRFSGNIELTQSNISQIESLVELLESNIFYQLRGHLQRPHQYPHLFKCLYGWLMLMPQGKAFQTLQVRLNPITIPCIGLSSYSYVN